MTRSHSPNHLTKCKGVSDLDLQPFTPDFGAHLVAELLGTLRVSRHQPLLILLADASYSLPGLELGAVFLRQHTSKGRCRAGTSLHRWSSGAHSQRNSRHSISRQL